MHRVKVPTGSLLTTKRLLTALALTIVISQPVLAVDKISADSPLTGDQQKALIKAAAMAKKGQVSKATPIFENVLADCNDLPKCLAVATYTEGFGHPMLGVRRAVMEKALGLARTHDDFVLVALKGRQCECYDVTRRAIQTLIDESQTPEELTDLARKALEVSMHDVAHLAMTKEYKLVRSVPEALEYAKAVSSMGMDDLLRKVIRELIDDENNAHNLCTLLRSIEVYHHKDLNRYLLKKALDTATTVEQFREIWVASAKHQQKDIHDVAAYRGKKYMIMNRNNERNAERQAEREAKEAANQAAQDAARNQAPQGPQAGQSVSGF